MSATWEIREGDALERLREMPSESVQCCVTSPPYFGLRDYGIDGQIGLEATPDEFVGRLVDVFREVRRVLRADGTLWLNIGDSYNSGSQNNGHQRKDGTKSDALHDGNRYSERVGDEWPGHRPMVPGSKAKDLLGIPWLLAFALRQPYYAGRIADERERIWLAAMIDAEGCIYIHRRREGQNNGQGYSRKADSFGSGLEIANTSERIVQRCMEITGRGSISRQDKDRRQPLYRWCLRTNECCDVLREVYPYLIAKQHEARLSVGVPSSGPQATAAWEALKILHGGGLTDVDFPAPASLHTPGWYLRSDVIWSKLNPMPESVTDRPTSAHEHVFLLAKSRTYFYDADAIAESSATSTQERAHLGTRPISDRQRAMQEAGMHGESDSLRVYDRVTRNRRNVWEIATQPYPDAHFATFPPKLVEPCILAGSSPKACGECGAPWERVTAKEARLEGNSARAGRGAEEIAVAGKWTPEHLNGNANLKAGPVVSVQTLGWQPSCAHHDDTGHSVILDPFAGAGTTGLVALRHDRSFIGIELNSAYAEMARERIRQDAPLLNCHAEVAA